MKRVLFRYDPFNLYLFFILFAELFRPNLRVFGDARGTFIRESNCHDFLGRELLKKEGNLWTLLLQDLSQP